MLEGKKFTTTKKVGFVNLFTKGEVIWMTNKHLKCRFIDRINTKQLFHSSKRNANQSPCYSLAISIDYKYSQTDIWIKAYY